MINYEVMPNLHFFIFYAKKQCCSHSDIPAIVPANAPDTDTCDWLRMKHTAVHGVDQVQHIILQQQVHVLPLNKQTHTQIS